MKFWQRAFFSVLMLFIFCFYISIFLVSNFSYRTSLNSERERSFGEAYFIAASLKKEMSQIADNRDEYSETDYSFFYSYVNFYQKRNIYLSLWENESFLDGNIPWTALEKYNVTPERQVSTVKKYNNTKYMLVISSFHVGANEFTLVYAHDLQSFVQEHSVLARFLALSAAVISVLLASGLYVLLRRLSKPIENLDDATGRISSGDFSMRVPVQGKDELAALATNFNSMAVEIERRLDELQDATEQKQRFIDNLAHELRTPLTTIRGYAEYLKNANIKEDDRITSVDYIITESVRIEELSNKLLELALLRNSPLELSEVNMAKIIRELSEKLYPKLSAKNIRLKYSCQLESVTADQTLLECLLDNLIDNAIKASLCGTEIYLVCYTENECKVIEVRDYGKGISAEHIQRLTEPFYRVDKSRSRADGGAGLGLTLCSQIAQLCKAKLEFLSEEGIGTVARVVFTTS